eukprot:CAMPEP_0202415492 /NCGR_PEP_ID=MMETSP1128-20130828/36354_1 /ASSEMBLY_ACC=CAM_ASM_000463 /TAXON_ID=3047 /ORGANISM="Dunaliella tertiolecta, Strain CCMP1320" /LENGTH=80 /DNA_ID=CAMNT_0049022189 /DNA_START=22 /DNA_END=264 /DNA_ORIENTATION=+
MRVWWCLDLGALGSKRRGLALRVRLMAHGMSPKGPHLKVQQEGSAKADGQPSAHVFRMVLVVSDASQSDGNSAHGGDHAH